MTIKRDLLLKRVIDAKHNDFVKIITGIRRCGKSYLIFNLFKRHLVKSGVRKDHIIEIDLENKSIKVEVSDEEITERLKTVKLPNHPAEGVMNAYRAMAQGADKGALWLYRK